MLRTQRSRGRVTAWVLGAAAVLGLGAAQAFAGEAKSPNGLQVAIDPVTRQLRQPTAAESRQLTAQSAAKSAAAPQVTQWADGTLSMVLTEEYLNVWIVGLKADGTLSPACVDGYNAGATVSAIPAFEEK